MTNGRHILVVEDNEMLAGVVNLSLKNAGFTVTTATNGRDAWELIQQTCFDLVVTDHQMPGLTGSELCKRLRADEKYAKTPVIFITAKGLELNLRQIKAELGVNAALSKPFSLRRLVWTVQDCFADTAC
jgi:CheY-like chemotaxis protein